MEKPEDNSAQTEERLESDEEKEKAEQLRSVFQEA